MRKTIFKILDLWHEPGVHFLRATPDFIARPQYTQQSIEVFIREILESHPGLNTFTLSSTHLPWLMPFLRNIFPQLNFLDPAEDVVRQLPLSPDGDGQLNGIFTEPVEMKSFMPLGHIIKRLGIELRLEKVEIEQRQRDVHKL